MSIEEAIDVNVYQGGMETVFRSGLRLKKQHSRINTEMYIENYKECAISKVSQAWALRTW